MHYRQGGSTPAAAAKMARLGPATTVRGERGRGFGLLISAIVYNRTFALSVWAPTPAGPPLPPTPSCRDEKFPAQTGPALHERVSSRLPFAGDLTGLESLAVRRLCIVVNERGVMRPAMRFGGA